MPIPGGARPDSQQPANLKTKRLIYIRQEDLFRFVADNPST